MNSTGILALIALLAGCSSLGLSSLEAPPENYRVLAQAHVRETYFSPLTIRDAEIAPPRPSGGPILVSTGLTEVWVVCIRSNSKTQLGVYSGRKSTALMIQEDRIVGSQDNPAWDSWCSHSQFGPFPEISRELSEH